jgi:hypothetical protein
MIIFPEDLSPPSTDLRGERITINPKFNSPRGNELIGSYVVQSNHTLLWQAIRVKIDQAYLNLIV